MVETPAVRVCLTCGVPLMVGSPVAGVLAAITAAVGSLVRLSLFPSSSVNDTFTLIVFPRSAATGV